MGIFDLLDILDPNLSVEDRYQNRRIRGLEREEVALRAAVGRDQALAQLRDDANQASLRQVIAKQAHEIAELNLALTVLVQLLADRGVIAEDAYQKRVSLELSAIQATAPAPTPAAVDKVQCMSCMQWFARAQTTITERGTFCDRCGMAQR